MAKQAARGDKFFRSGSGAHFRRALTLLSRQCLESLRQQATAIWTVEVKPPHLQVAFAQLWNSICFSPGIARFGVAHEFYCLVFTNRGQ